MPYMFSVLVPGKGTSSKANIRIFVVTLQVMTSYQTEN